jgi:SAM-dependent methyltransferase
MEVPGESEQRTSNSLTVPKSNDNRRDSVNVQLMEAQHMGFETMAKLRFSALMTSKWLSFGRVLFSPAHFELKNAKEDRVLVLDGLGKDWSFYVALNYSNAMIYNLGPDPVESNAFKNASIGSQSNHRHIHHPSLLSHFPFPKGFFAAVVFRFPGITSEASYRFALGECKRVLRPGGHLEVSVLDMDMLNMGNLGRRALRSLKEQINADDPSVSLKPISDTIQRLLGRRGFENLNRCFVGVPAAGGIPNSREGSSDQSPLSGSPVKTSFNTQKMSDIGELLRDQSGSGDDGVTRMVGRVARWWYSRCYESHVLSSGEMSQSIWSDEALLDECEKRGTSLRLMVCFAQKPECAVRRTISV